MDRHHTIGLIVVSAQGAHSTSICPGITVEMNAEGTIKAWGTPLEADVPAAGMDSADPAYVDITRLAATVCGSALASLSVEGNASLWCTADALVLPAAVPLTRLHTTAAAQLTAADGQPLGLLTLHDRSIRELNRAQRDSLKLLARQAASLVELKTRVAELSLLPQPSEAAAMSHALLQSAPVAIYHASMNSKMSYVNTAYRQVFGLLPEQSDDDWAQSVNAADRARIEEIWTDFRRQPRPIKFEYRMVPVNGVVRYLCEEVVPVDGLSGFVGTISDFTDLVTARGSLRKAESLFQNTFDQAPIGIAYLDQEGRVARCNPAFCALLGYSSDNLGTLSTHDFIHSDERTTHTAELARLWRSEIAIVDGEKRYLRADGSFVWVRSTMVLVRDVTGEPESAVEFLRDVSDRKQSELNLERVNRELVTASRTAGMAEVATNVLHNVGNILNSVNISASLVAERVKQSKAPGVSKIATLLKDQGARVGEYIGSDPRGKLIPEYLASLGEQLFTDQRMTLQELASLRDNLEHIKDTVSMQQSYAKLCGVTETVEVTALVEDSLRLNAGAFARHGVTLVEEFIPVPPITIDKHKVLQILVNLIRNAKYACDESGRTDKVVTLRIEPISGGARISVIDNGIGIKPENMGRLFSHGFTTRKSGHGFGLHSGALAAQELGGTLRAESDGPGCGAAFVLEIPAQPREALT